MTLGFSRMDCQIVFLGAGSIVYGSSLDDEFDMIKKKENDDKQSPNFGELWRERY